MLPRLLLTLALLAAWAPRLFAGPIENLRPGEWYRVPNSHLRNVVPNPLPPGDPSAIMGAWSGAAYDSKRGRLVVWGGGHSDYSGNELYVFDVNALSWQRLMDPSYNVGGDETTGYYPDGKPRSRHTYEYLEYLAPPFDRFCSFGASGMYPSGQVTIGNVDCFNFDNLQWERYADAPSYGIGATTAYDPVKGHAWVHGTESRPRLAEFNPTANSWATRGTDQSDLAFNYRVVAEIDPVRRKYVVIGGGVAASWNIDATGTLVRTNLSTTGATGILSAVVPGLAYDPVSDRLVAWNGGADVYVLNMDTLVWTRTVPAATNLVVPTAANPQGTNGRFRYMPSKNAFIVVNSIDEDVYIYKLTSGGGAPPDSIVPSTTLDLRPR